MIGLIIKDLRMMKLGFVWVTVFVILFCAITSSLDVACVLTPSITSGLLSSSMTMDNNCGWNAFAVSSGISRRDLVKSKFVTGTIFILIGTFIGFAISAVTIIVDGELPSIEILSASLLGFTVGMIAMSVSTTVSYFVDNNQRSAYISMLFTIACVVSLASLSDIVVSTLEDELPFIMVIILIMIILVLCLSKLSVHRFETKNL